MDLEEEDVSHATTTEADGLDFHGSFWRRGIEQVVLGGREVQHSSSRAILTVLRV